MSVRVLTEPFVVKHYVGNAHPSIKGNGFDGLVVGEEREEAEEFITAVNALIPLQGAVCAHCGAALKKG